MENDPTNRRHRPHLRCGICDEPFSKGERRRNWDGEMCHVTCTEERTATLLWELQAEVEERYGAPSAA